MYIYIVIVYLVALFDKKAKMLVRGTRAAKAELKAICKLRIGKFVNEQQQTPSSLRATSLKEDGRGKKEEGMSPLGGRRSPQSDGETLRGCVWVHAASVGEFEQARPIIERLRREQPGRKILLTFFSPSGYEMRKDYDQVDKVSYLPFATRRNAKLFLQAYEPEMAIFVKYEFWPAYLRALKKRGIPTSSIATIFRENQLFFRWWGGWYRRLLGCFTTLFVQDERSRALLERYGYENAVVAGDTRFDRVVEILKDQREIPQLMRFTEPEISPVHFDAAPPKVIVAGSTWPKDEQLLARYMGEHPELKLVLTPHEIGPEHMHQIFNLFEGRLVRLSEATLMNVNTNQVLLIDRMGMLSRLYRFATVAYIGGGFGAGIHNTLEAAVYGVPVVFGPRYHKFREAEDLIAEGGGMSVSDYASFAAAMDEALAHHEEYGRRAGEYVQKETGATNKIYNALFTR